MKITLPSLSLEPFAPAEWAVNRARITALEAQGWTFRQGSGGFIAELEGRRGVFALTLHDLLKRIHATGYYQSKE